MSCNIIQYQYHAIPRNTRVTQMGVWVKKQGSAKVKLQCILGLESIKQCQNIFECCIPFIPFWLSPMCAELFEALWHTFHNTIPFPPKLEWLEEQGSPLWRRADIVIILTGSTFRNTLYTLYIVHCTLYNVLYTLLHYTLYILLYTNWNTLIH